MLDKVREAALVFVFKHRARIDDEPKLGAGLRLSVLPDVVAEPVRQPAHRNQRIDWNGLTECGVQNVRGDRRLLRAGEADGRHDRRHEEHQPDASGKSHGAHLRIVGQKRLTYCNGRSAYHRGPEAGARTSSPRGVKKDTDSGRIRPFAQLGGKQS